MRTKISSKISSFFLVLFALIASAYEDMVAFYAINQQLGGYVHDTAMSQFIPCTAFHIVTGTWTEAAGQVAGTIAMHKAATAETATVNVPIMIPSNSVALKGAYLKSIEIDYELLIAACTSVTATVNKVSRGVDTAVAVVAVQTSTQNLTAGTNAATVDQHKLTVTLTTPIWILNTEYVLLKVAFVAAATTTIDLLSAVANFTERI